MDNDVQILDKTFTIHLPESDIQQRIIALAQEINGDYTGRDPLVVSILNGSFMFTADLMRELDWDPEIQFMRLSSYAGGMSSTGQMRVLLDLEVSVENRDVLIVEDIVDTGRTLEWLRQSFIGRGANSVRLATLLYKAEAFRADTPPEYVGFTIPNAFVVGYGMDYKEHGRGLRSVYRLKS